MELYPLLPGESIELRARDPKTKIVRKQVFVTSWNEIADTVAPWDIDYDVYWGAAPRRPGPDGQLHGRTENVFRIPVVWLDFDGYKGEFSKEDRLRQLEDAPPSVLVDSGGGYHAYWRMAQDMAPGVARRLMKGMTAYFHSDDVSDPPRVLRVPNTRNFKFDPPRFVELLEDNDRLWLPEELPVAAVEETEPSSVNLAARALLISEHGIQKSGETIDGEYFAGRNEALFELARYHRDNYKSYDDTLEACRSVNEKMQPPLEDREVVTCVKSVFTRDAPLLVTEVVEAPLAASIVVPSGQIMSYHEVLGFDEPPIEMMAAGMYARSSIEFIAHPPKSGKTTIALNWGMRMAAGIDGGGLRQIKKAVHVLLWQPNADMSPRRTREWMRKIGTGLGLPEKIPFDFRFDDGNSTLPENIKWIEERAADYDIVIIDSLNRFLPGVDAADTEVVASSYNVVRRLRTRFPEVCWSYIVQVGKNSAAHLGTTNPSFALRGNSANAEAYDTLIQLLTPKNTERDKERGLCLNRHIVFHGRDADMYRSPFRTRYDLDTHVLEFESDLTFEEAVSEQDGSDRDSRKAQRNVAVDLLNTMFNDAEELTGERRILASEAYAAADEYEIGRTTLGRALSVIGGNKDGHGKQTYWVDFVVDIEEAK